MASSTEEVDASNVETVSKADGGTAVVRIAPSESIQTADDRKKASLSQNEREQEFSDAQDRSIADGEVKRLFFTNDSFAPNGATVTDVEYRLRIEPGEDDDEGENFYAEDYEIYVSSSQSEGTREDVNVYNNFGGRTDGGNDDDDADDADIYLDWRSVSLFDDEDANQYWGFVIKDTQSGDRGQIDYLEMRIHYEVPTTLVPPELDGPGTSDRDDPEVVETLTPTLKWDEVDGADEYGLYVSEAPFGSENIVYRDESIDDNDDELVVPSDELQPGTNYRWNMVSKADGDESDVSSTLYFQTGAGAPSAPELNSPGDDDSPGPVLSGTEQTFEWESVSGAERYGLYVRNETTDELVVDDDYVRSTSQSKDLTAGHEYKWETRAYANGQWSDFSENFYFQIEAAAPSVPTAKSPGRANSDNPERIETLTPTFTWDEVSDADEYGLYIRDLETGDLYSREYVTGDSFELPEGVLEAGKRYRWNMVSVKNGTESDVSNTLYFRTEESGGNRPPASPTLAAPGGTSSPGPLLSESEQTFQWKSVSEADRYGLYVKNQETGEFVIDTDNISSGQTSYSKTLEEGGEYKWDMRAYANGQWSEYSEDFYFQTEESDGGGGSVARSFAHPVGDGGEVLEESISPETNPYYPDNATPSYERPSSPPPGQFWKNKQDVGSYLESLGGVHAGEDWNYGSGSADVGRSVYATANGRVLDDVRVVDSNGDPEAAGYAIIIEHTLPSAETYYSLYLHVVDASNDEGKISLPTIGGEKVDKGERIARIGNITELGDHLHFEIRNDNWNPNGKLYPNDNGTAYYSDEVGVKNVGGMSASEVAEAFDLMEEDGILDPSDFIDRHSDGSPPPPTAGACPENPDANPAPETISGCIDDLAEKYKVPGIIIRALLQQENGAWDNTIESGDGGIGLTQITIKDDNVTEPGKYARIPLGYITGEECPEDLEQGHSCYDGGRNDNFTISVNRNERVSFSKLKNNWVSNLKTGVRRLLAKKALDAFESASDHRILENWYNALAFYNGYVAFDNEDDTNFDDEFEIDMPDEYCPDPDESLEGKCYNDPGFSYPRKGKENRVERWNDKQSFPYQETVFNTLSQPHSISNRSRKGFPDQVISVTLPGPSDVGKPDAGGYNFVWADYSEDYDEGRGSKFLDFYIEDGKGYARKSIDCGSDGRFDEIPSDCAWETPVPVTVHRVENFSDHDAEAVGSAGQRMTLDNPNGPNLISFAEDPSTQNFADLPVSSQAAAAGASGTASSEASAAGSLSEYVFWLGDGGTIEYGRISEVDPKPKRGYFIFVDGDAPVTINYSGETANPDVSLHRTMNMTGPTRSTTFASNESVYEEGIYYVEDGEPVRVDPQSEALNPGTAYFLAADEATTYRPSDASSAAAPSTASAAPDTTERPAQRAKIEHMLDRVSARFASLRGAPAKADSLRAASASSETSETCDPDASGAFAVCFAVDQEVSYDDPPLPLELAVETASGATNGWEDDADVVQVEFSTPGLPHAYIDEGYGLQTSAKPSNGDEKTWPLLVQSASELPDGSGNTNDMDLSWDVDQIPSGRTARLLDENGEVLVNDMTDQSSLSLDVEESNTQWRLEIQLSEDDSGGSGPALASEVFLEGAYDAGSDDMTTSLNDAGLLPTDQPYDRAPWNYDGSESTVDAPSDAVDWVLLELRSGTPDDAPMTTVARRAAFLESDGEIVNPDGSSPVVFSEADPGDYYVVVHHRNHLPVMSVGPVSLTGSGLTYDFTSGPGQAYGSGAMADLGGGAYGLVAGDADHNGQVQNRDKNEIWDAQVGRSGYALASDFNLDGESQNRDKNSIWTQSVGAGSFLPNAEAASSSSPALLASAASTASQPPSAQQTTADQTTADTGLTFTFANTTLVEEDDRQYLVCDVQIAAGESGTRLGDTQVYFNYNTAALGSSLAANDRIEVTKGTLLQKQAFGGSTAAYSLTNVADNTSEKVSIVYEYLFAENNPDQGATVPTSPETLFHIRVPVTDDAENANLSFDEELMTGNQYQSDNATTYSPITATDTQVGLPVELAALSARTDGRAAVLEWKTLTETNNAGFYIERKTESGTWKTVGGLIEGAGTSQEARRYSHRIEDLDFGTHTFRLRQIDADGGEAVLNKRARVEVQMRDTHVLGGTHPNPFRERATVEFAVKEAQPVTVALYNTLGQRVRTLKDGQVPGGETITLTLRADDLSSGVYFVRLRGEDFAATETVTLVR